MLLAIGSIFLKIVLTLLVANFALGLSLITINYDGDNFFLKTSAYSTAFSFLAFFVIYFLAIICVIINSIWQFV